MGPKRRRAARAPSPRVSLGRRLSADGRRKLAHNMCLKILYAFFCGGGSRRRRFLRFCRALVASRIFLMTTMASAEAFLRRDFGRPLAFCRGLRHTWHSRCVKTQPISQITGSLASIGERISPAAIALSNYIAKLSNNTLGQSSIKQKHRKTRASK